MGKRNKELVLEYLRSIAPKVATNSQIRESTGIQPHQQVFQITQDLMSVGLIRGEQRGREWVFWAEESAIGDKEIKIARGGKLPQNVQALIGEIGEKQVLLRLFLLVQHTPWEVFHNLGEAGYDILLLNPENGERIRIEVKTRQRIYTTGKRHGMVHFFLTDGEYQACDFLVAYFMDHNGFYVVPKGDLKQARSGKRTRWRFTLTMNKQGEPPPRFAPYRDAWHTVHPDFANKET